MKQEWSSRFKVGGTSMPRSKSSSKLVRKCGKAVGPAGSRIRRCGKRAAARVYSPERERWAPVCREHDRSVEAARAASTCWRCPSSTCCSTFNRSRSLALNSIRSVSIPPPTRDETGHFYFAQTGHSHFAATVAIRLLDIHNEMHYFSEVFLL